jgi:hypothetical protein
MRNHLLGAMLAVALTAPCAAFAQTGHVDLSYANRDYDFGGFGTDFDDVTFGGQFAFGGALGAQVDGYYGNWEADSGGETDVWGLGVHVFARRDAWLVGAYVGYDDMGDFNLEVLTGALEGQYYLPRSTISGVLSYSEADIPAAYSITMLEGEYRYFFTDNLSVHGAIGIGSGDIGAADPDVWSGELGAEYQFDAAPISVFGSFHHNTLDFSTGEIEVDAMRIGVRYNWGGTLMDRDRRGAGLKRVRHVFERFLT